MVGDHQVGRRFTPGGQVLQHRDHRLGRVRVLERRSAAHHRDASHVDNVRERPVADVNDLPSGGRQQLAASSPQRQGDLGVDREQGTGVSGGE
ncbi:MAG: hypothetical protein WKF73_09030 [Nocardioidaceae bacterium]